MPPQLPSIASTANRRILPTADLQIEGASPAAFGGDIGAGLQGLGESVSEAAGAVAQFQLAKEAEDERLAEFDRQAQFVEFGSALGTKLQEAQRNIEGPAQDFTKNFMGGFDADATAFLEKVPERHKNAWRAKMQALRSGLAKDALASEFGQRDAWSNNTLTKSLTALQNGATQSPDKLDEWRQQGLDLIGASLLSPQAKADRELEWRANVAVAAAQGDVLKDPEGAIIRLGGIDHVTALEAAGEVDGPSPDAAAYKGPDAGGGKGGDVSFAGGGAGASAVRVMNYEAREAGFNAVPASVKTLGGFVDYAKTVNAAGVASSAGGVYQIVGKTMKSYAPVALGPNWRNAPYDFASQDKVARAVFNANKGSARSLRSQWVSLSVSEAERIRKLPWEQARQVIARKESGGDPAKLSGKPVAAPAKPVAKKEDAPAKPAVVLDGNPDTKEADAKPGDGADPYVASVDHPDEAPPVDPRYADIPLSARLQLIEGAQREIDRREQVEYAVEQKMQNDWLDEFMMDLEDGKAGRADIEAARTSGHIDDYNTYTAAINIVERKEQASAALDLYNAMVEGGGEFNPYDKNATAAVDAAVAAQGGTPKAAFDVWQRTGVLGKTGAVALRGALISTDPAQVASAASIAYNMLTQNPNAFAAVEGGDDIERSALLYGHYVNDLGMSAQQAVAKVASQNSPEMRRKIDMSKADTAEFRKRILKKDVANMLSNEKGGWFVNDPEFTAPAQRLAVAQDYAEFAEDHYSRNGDEAAAEAYAFAQIKKLYGVANGRLMKFPPTKAYPLVGGSHAYLFEQAAADIKKVTGRKIDPSRVYFMPIRGGATAQAYRKGGAVPYEIHYIDRTADGQDVYRVLTGKAFTADVGKAQKVLQAKRKGDFERAKQLEAATPTWEEEYARQRGGGG